MPSTERVQLDTLTWKREGYSSWIVPETYILRNAAGAIYAKVRKDEHGWTWYTTQTASTYFRYLMEAQAAAEGYVRTHPELLALNH